MERTHFRIANSPIILVHVFLNHESYLRRVHYYTDYQADCQVLDLLYPPACMPASTAVPVSEACLQISRSEITTYKTETQSLNMCPITQFKVPHLEYQHNTTQ